MSSHQNRSAEVGDGSFRFTASETWARVPAGWSFGEVVGVATDSKDRVFVFSRSEHPLTVFDQDGKFLKSWGEGEFVRPHGIHIGLDDAVYLTDDQGHTIRKYTADGKLLLTLGDRNTPSNTGVVNGDYRTIQQAAGPFNMPTNVAIGPDGSLYAVDGYGNARVHKFSADGKLDVSWGQPGTKPGEFNLPHGIAVNQNGEVYVADRENSRIQIFDANGRFLREWTNVARPTEVFISARGKSELVFISELGYRAGMFPGAVAPSNPAGSRVSIFSPDGHVLARWGGGDNPCATGDFFAAHDIWVDSTGSLYVSEVTLSAGGNRGAVPRTCHTLQKFVRQN